MQNFRLVLRELPNHTFQLKKEKRPFIEQTGQRGQTIISLLYMLIKTSQMTFNKLKNDMRDSRVLDYLFNIRMRKSLSERLILFLTSEIESDN